MEVVFVVQKIITKGETMVDFIVKYHWHLFLLCFPIAFLLVPIAQWIEYKLDCKKYGKEQADEIWKRMI